MAPVVTVGAKRTMEYVLTCLSLFNRGVEEVNLVSLGDCISKAADVYRILSEQFGASLSVADITPLRHGESVLTCSSYRLRAAALAGDASSPWVRGENQFISFPVYHLLIDNLLATQRQLVVGAAHGKDLLRILSTPDGFVCQGGDGLEFGVDGQGKDGAKRRPPRDQITEALYRTGILVSDRWFDLARRLGQYDDVVLGLDTNILYNCVVTQQILDALVFTCHSSASPNWILLVVPSTVMHELEQAANNRDERGELRRIGRMGYRALQEILELDQAKDIRGVSLLISGETSPILDTRVELQGLRDDVKNAAGNGIRFSPKMSFGDTLIRDQFKSFLRQVSFHKGAFFLTGDKSNCALGQAEGLHSLYVPPANGRRAIVAGGKLGPFRIPYNEQEQLPISVPIGKLIYELAVQFGEIFLSWDGSEIKVACDGRGDSLEHWLQRDLIIRDLDLRRLTGLYPASGRVPLGKAEATWEREYKMAMSW